MINTDSLPDFTGTYAFYLFVWNFLSEFQKIRMSMIFELKADLEKNTGIKRNVYKKIAEKYNISYLTVEKIANTEL